MRNFMTLLFLFSLGLPFAAAQADDHDRNGTEIIAVSPVTHD